jgi:phospholipase C
VPSNDYKGYNPPKALDGGFVNRFLSFILLLVLLVACVPAPAANNSNESTFPVPNFEHIIMIVFENKGFETVIGNPLMPTYNKLAKEYTLLTDFYAIRHPSLPNYLALIGGDTFGISIDCNDCFIDAPSLPDLIEASGRTWKTYQEDMPEACFLGDYGHYAQKHNPFVYFDPIRTDQSRCEQSIVPLTDLQRDIDMGSLPNFLFITPNLCNDSHDCSLDVTDAWLENLLATLTPALDNTSQSYLVVILFEEAQRPDGLGKLWERGGGHVAVVLYSPLVKKGFEDPTRYNHYSLLKTISAAWGLSYLGHAADNGNVLISAPWK